MDIHVRSLRDVQEVWEPGSFDEDGEQGRHLTGTNWSLFGVVWSAGITLARLMSTYDIAGRRVLEVGCGLGLASLVLNQRREKIFATDYNPQAEEFLQANTALNSAPKIPFQTAHWEDLQCGLGLFDLIIGSDLLYERGRAEMLSAFIDAHAERTCEVIMVDPGRGQIGRFGSAMKALGYTDKLLENPSTDADQARVQTHQYLR